MKTMFTMTKLSKRFNKSQINKGRQLNKRYTHNYITSQLQKIEGILLKSMSTTRKAAGSGKDCVITRLLPSLIR